MSAIFGLVNLNGQPVVGANLERMSAALADHGCDGGGIWAQGAVGLGQRLMCFTPEDHLERQPLASADGQRVLVCDGRIDNRPELMCELGIPPAEARALPDSAFILNAYARWGEDCVHHLIGVLAFALWDANMQCLLAVRSPIAAPALVYYAAPQAFAFATMPRGLLTLPFVPRALNERKIAGFLTGLGEPRSTFYRDIFYLPSGHLLTVGRDGVTARCYWHLDPGREIRFPHEHDYAEAFNDLLERVIGDHLRSVTPVGAMMSGGLDSSSVAVTAARLLQSQGKRLAAFTEVPRTGFDGPVPRGRYADETPLVQAIARGCDNLDLNLIHTDGRTFLQDLDRLFTHLEAPFRNTSNRVWMEAIMDQARQRGVRAMLDGVQGNLTASWYGSGLLPRLIREGRWLRAWREARSLVQRGAARSTWRMVVGQGLMPLLPGPLWLVGEWLRGGRKALFSQTWCAYSAIHPDFAAAQQVEACAREQGRSYRFRQGADARQERYEALASQELGILATAYRAMFGVDSRSPLADVRMAEFCLALPEEQYLHDGEPRALVRRAMAGRLPPEVLASRQRGLQAADWFERLSGARDEVVAELERLEQSDLACRVLDLARMRRLAERWPQDDSDPGRVMREYRLVLQGGLMVGRFLRWFETGDVRRSG